MRCHRAVFDNRRARRAATRQRAATPSDLRRAEAHRAATRQRAATLLERPSSAAVLGCQPAKGWGPCHHGPRPPWGCWMARMSPAGRGYLVWCSRGLGTAGVTTPSASRAGRSPRAAWAVRNPREHRSRRVDQEPLTEVAGAARPPPRAAERRGRCFDTTAWVERLPTSNHRHNLSCAARREAQREMRREAKRGARARTGARGRHQSSCVCI
jgi:hypothetical protein